MNSRVGRFTRVRFEHRNSVGRGASVYVEEPSTAPPIIGESWRPNLGTRKGITGNSRQRKAGVATATPAFRVL